MGIRDVDAAVREKAPHAPVNGREQPRHLLDTDPFELTNVPANATLKATMAARLHQLQTE